jgi:hypothetical protein
MKKKALVKVLGTAFVATASAVLVKTGIEVAANIRHYKREKQAIDKMNELNDKIAEVEESLSKSFNEKSDTEETKEVNEEKDNTTGDSEPVQFLYGVKPFVESDDEIENKFGSNDVNLFEIDPKAVDKVDKGDSLENIFGVENKTSEPLSTESIHKYADNTKKSEQSEEKESSENTIASDTLEDYSKSMYDLIDKQAKLLKDTETKILKQLQDFETEFWTNFNNRK